jgi:hypothetical protein
LAKDLEMGRLSRWTHSNDKGPYEREVLMIRASRRKCDDGIKRLESNQEGPQAKEC